MKDNIKKEVQILKDSIKTYIKTNNKSIKEVAFELATNIEEICHEDELNAFQEKFKKLLNRSATNPRVSTLKELQRYYEYLNPEDAFAFEREILGDELFNSFFKK